MFCLSLCVARIIIPGPILNFIFKDQIYVWCNGLCCRYGTYKFLYLIFKVQGARRIAQWIKALAFKPDGLSFGPQDPLGRKRKPIPESCSDLHTCAMVHVFTHNK